MRITDKSFIKEIEEYTYNHFYQLLGIDIRPQLNFNAINIEPSCDYKKLKVTIFNKNSPCSVSYLVDTNTKPFTNIIKEKKND